MGNSKHFQAFVFHNASVETSKLQQQLTVCTSEEVTYVAVIHLICMYCSCITDYILLSQFHLCLFLQIAGYLVRVYLCIYYKKLYTV